MRHPHFLSLPSYQGHGFLLPLSEGSGEEAPTAAPFFSSPANLCGFLHTKLPRRHFLQLYIFSVATTLKPGHAQRFPSIAAPPSLWRNWGPAAGTDGRLATEALQQRERRECTERKKEERRAGLGERRINVTGGANKTKRGRRESRERAGSRNGREKGKRARGWREAGKRRRDVLSPCPPRSKTMRPARESDRGRYMGSAASSASCSSVDDGGGGCSSSSAHEIRPAYSERRRRPQRRPPPNHREKPCARQMKRNEPRNCAHSGAERGSRRSKDAAVASFFFLFPVISLAHCTQCGRFQRRANSME